MFHNFYFLLISLRSCFQRHFSRGLIAWSSQRGWRWSLYILLMSSVVSLCFSFSPLFSSLVLALTSTPTFSPLFPSSTPEPTLDTSCPNGTQPSGWGTVTPDPYWVNQCLRCVTPVGTLSPLFTTSTPSWIGTGTPPPSCTPIVNGIGTPDIFGCEYATSTPTPLPTSTPSACGGFTVSFVSVSNGWGNAAGSLLCAPEGDNYRCQGAFTGTDLHDTTDYPFTYVLRFTNYMGMYIIGHEDISLGQYGLFPNRNIQVTGNNQIGGWMNPLGGWVWNGTQNNYDMSFSIGTGGVSGTPQNVTVDLLFSRSAACSILPTPTPSPSPTPISNFCAVVASENSSDDSVFSLPVPGMGSKTCPVNIDGITIPLYGAFGWGDLQTSPIRICLQEITFGHLIYYGLDINIDYFAYVLAAAFILRMILRS